MESSFFTERLQLRPLTLDDAGRVEELASDYDIAKTTLSVPHPYPAGAATGWIQSLHESEAAGTGLYLAITLPEEGLLIGVIELRISPHHKRAELAYWVGKPYWGMGYGTEAAKKIIAIGFAEYDLNKIFSAAFADNPGSWRIMEKIGMKHEGTLKHHVIKWGQPMDLVYYGLLKEDYLR